MDIKRKLLKIINKQQGEMMAFNIKHIPVVLKDSNNLSKAVNILLEAYDNALRGVNNDNL